MFKKILIANRGEIACRVARTARRLGIATVAVYSDADAHAQHVAACDEAIRLGPPAARESYLRGDLILAIARATGAQAIHPGYGFLSENEDFAQACADAGVVFIGPPPKAIAAMGSKSAAKRLMEAARVPLVPGYHGEDQDAALLAREATRIGYPVLIKASAGGGGKGMRIVEREADFAAALASCQREAKASFGDERVLVEKYLVRPRHIEIQVFADAHGHCIDLFERDCSVQRRHQKVLEEAPAPGLSEERRRQMGDAAVAAARAVGYVGAGTCEFIADQGGAFYFMEMNTRLQVEHPVTEMITGLDLVEWQLRVAAGEPLPDNGVRPAIDGHAIEARIYAENPDTGFLPSTGTLTHLSFPAAVQFEVRDARGQKAAVRVDSGVRSGDAISPHYDPMIAKLIVWGADRRQAMARMRQALAATHVSGLHTNVAFLSRLVAGGPFADGELDTGLIERHRDTLLPAPSPLSTHEAATAVAALLARERNAAADTGTTPDDPWQIVDGWRPNAAGTRRFVLERIGARSDAADGGAEPVSVEVEYARNGSATTRTGDEHVCLARLALAGHRLSGLIGDRTLSASVVFAGDVLTVFDNGRQYSVRDTSRTVRRADTDALHGGMTAPMPGKIIAVNVKAGQKVEKGQLLLVMEAMKMEHSISAPSAGTIGAVRCSVGEQVAEGAALVVFE